MASPPPPPPSWQFAVAGYTPMLTANMSVIGSSLIVYSILGPGRAEKLKKPHLRLLLGMSLSDILYSTFKAWTFLFAPVGYGLPGAVGNMATCRMQGFVIQMAHCTAAYNALLSTYYWLTVCRGLKNEAWSPWEPLMHAGIILLNVILGSAGVATRLYNPSFSFCFIAAYPPGCETGTGSPPCQYYPQSKIPLMYELFANMFVQFYIAVVFATCFAIWWAVRQQENAMRNYGASRHQRNHRSDSKNVVIASSSRSLRSMLMSGRASASRSQRTADCAKERDVVDYSSSTVQSTRIRQRENQEQQPPRQQAAHQQRNHQVLVQCALYAGSFLLCWIGPVMFHLLGWFKQYQSFAFVVCIVVITPLQGFFNAIVFARPTFVRVRRKYPHITRWDAFKRVFFAEDPMQATCSCDSQASKMNASTMMASNLRIRSGRTEAIPEAEEEADCNDMLYVDPSFPFDSVGVNHSTASVAPATEETSKQCNNNSKKQNGSSDDVIRGSNPMRHPPLISETEDVESQINSSNSRIADAPIVQSGAQAQVVRNEDKSGDEVCNADLPEDDDSSTAGLRQEDASTTFDRGITKTEIVGTGERCFVNEEHTL